MRIRLRSKLIVALLLYLVLVGAVGLIGLYAAEASLVGMHSAVDHHVHEVSLVGQLGSDLNVLQSTLLLHTLSNSPDELIRYEQEISLVEAHVDGLIDDLQRTQEQFDDRVDLERIAAFSSAWATFVRVENEQYLPVSRVSPDAEAYQLARADGPLGRSWADARNTLADLQVTLPSESVAQLQIAEQEFALNRNLIALTLLGAAVLGVGIGISQATRLARAIEALSHGARRVAAGDLGHRVRVRTGDEIEALADSFNTMTSSLASVTERQQEQFRALEAEVAERQRAVAALRNSEERFRSVTETVNEGIVSFDAEGRILFWNRGAKAIFGYTEAEVLGRPLTILLAAQHQAEYQDGFARAAVGDALGRTIELWGVRQDQTEVSLELSVAEWTNGGDRFYTATIRDVTERRAVERMKNEFVSMVSHELRTPMNGVIGMTDLLLRRNLGAQEREYAEAVQRSGEALLAIIDEILDLSKIEAGRFELETGRVDVRGVLEDVVTLLAEPARRKALELVCVVDPAVPAGLGGDANRLRQILLNLIGNAIKFTDRGEIVVRGSLEYETPETVTLRCEIRDTGIGIGPDARDRLFQVFSQADASMTRRYGGTGLGLAISKRLAELMGGKIGFDSAPGRGSTFWFTTQFARLADVSLWQAPAILRGRRVLIVDDNASTRAALAEVLAACGMRPTSVADPPSAVAALRAAAQAEAPFAVALLDRVMPDGDGLALADQVTGDPRLAATRLVLLTCTGETPPPEQLRTGGIVACLDKPVRRSRLVDTMTRLLSGDAPPATPTAVTSTPTVTEGSAAPLPPAAASRILLVEDSATSSRVAAGMLRLLGYDVDVAVTGREALLALERAGDWPYAAILMDCHMPGMDGFEATAEIRRRESGGHSVPIIAMTASAMRGDRERCLAAGMDEYLSKPLRIGVLEDVLRRTIHGNRRPANGGSEDVDAAANMDADSPAIIDWTVFAELRHQLDRAGTGDDGALGAMVAEFRVEAAGRLQMLSQAAAQGDARAVAQAAHGLRGPASALGACEVCQLAAQLEHLAGQTITPGTATLIESLRAAVERVNAALQSAVTDELGCEF